MKNLLLLILIIVSPIVYGQSKSFDYAYMNKKGICVYSIAEKKEYPIGKGGQNPCISPDGKKLAYTDFDKKGGRFISIIDLNTKKVIILNTNSNNCYGPVWSPNGEFIAYNIFDTQKTNWSVAITDFYNSTPKFLTRQLGVCYMPSWSYDSKNLIVQNINNVLVLNLLGNIIKTYDVSKMEDGISALMKDVGPASSDRFILTSDNKKIVFTSEVNQPNGDGGPPTSIFIYDIESKSTTRLSPKGYFAQDIIIKGDKVLITASKIKSNIGGIYSVDMDGKNFKMLFPNCFAITAKN